jgi:hypothetical protein
VPTLRLAAADARSFGRDRRALSAALAAAQPQVAVVHNGPHLARWRTLSSTIAREAGLVVVGGGRRAGANLVLSSLSVDFVSVSDVRGAGSPLRPGAAVLARLRYRGARFAVAALGPEGATALRSALGEVAGLPLVICVSAGADALADLGQVVSRRVVTGPSVSAVEVETGAVLVVDVTLPES